MNNSDHKKIFFIGLIVKDNIVEDVVKILKKHKAKIHVTLDH